MGNSRVRQKARKELPRGRAGGEIGGNGQETGIDVFDAKKDPVDPNRPYIAFTPEPSEWRDMKKCEVGLLSSQPNAAVLTLPGRRFPGLLIQGDSLHVLHSLAKEASGLLMKVHAPGPEVEEASDVAQELESLLRGYLNAYELALKANNMQLPYNDVDEGVDADKE